MKKDKGLSFDGRPVGYKRPPVEHQFKKGNKPLNSGRRRESQNFEAMIGNLLDSNIAVIENGRKTRMSRKEALLQRAFARGMNGNMNDLARLFAIIERLAPSKTVAPPFVIRVQNIAGDEDE